MPNTALLGFVGIFSIIQEKFNNIHWNALTDISVPEGKTSPANGTDDNVDPLHADGRKFYECDGNHFIPDCPLPQHANSIGHGGRGGDGRVSHGHGIVNGDHGGGRNGSSSNINRGIHDGNLKPLVYWKYIHFVEKIKPLTFLVQPSISKISVSDMLQARLNYLQWEGLYCYFSVDPNYSAHTRGVISIHFASGNYQ